MVDPEVLSFAQVMAVIVMSIGSLTFIGLGAAHAGKRLRRSAAPVDKLALQQSDAKLEQLQQSIDSIAVEVERIAEAQRFSARLLAERTSATSLQHGSA